jgi:phospholipid transport system transporter-binding protein
MTVECGRLGAPAVDAAASGFSPVGENARWLLQGEVTTATASRILEESAALPLPAEGVVDCEAVSVIDSTAVALLLALKRRAKAEQRPLAFTNVPQPLMALAGVYGVENLLSS